MEALTGNYCSLQVPSPETGYAFKEAFLRYHPHTMVLGTAGDRTHHTLYIVDAVAPVMNAPKVVSVAIGTNNIGAFSLGHGSVEKTIEGISAVIKRIRAAYNDSTILVQALLPRADDLGAVLALQLNGYVFANSPYQRQIDDVNDKLLRDYQLGVWGAGVEFVDCSFVFPRGAAEDAQALMPDLLHPNAEGYRRWFDCVRPMIEMHLA